MQNHINLIIIVLYCNYQVENSCPRGRNNISLTRESRSCVFLLAGSPLPIIIFTVDVFLHASII